MISSYDFGSMTINGKKYRNDVIVFADKVIDNWWRREGHKVQVEDLQTVLDRKPKPEVLIVGTGYNGRVEISSEVRSTLKSHGIKLVDKPTKEAYHKFNNLLKANKLVAGAFHLTC